MSGISSVSSTSSLYPASAVRQDAYAQIGNDILAIGSALQSGTSTTDAQTALANFQQSVVSNLQTTATQLFSTNSQASSAYQTLVSAINSGDTKGAQQAYANLLSAFKSAQATSPVHHGHHHHRHHGAASTTSSSLTDSSSTTGFGTGAISGSTTDSLVDNDGSSLNVTA